MLIDFTVSNFKSIKSEQTLSMTASSLKEYKDNYFKNPNKKDIDLNILKFAVIYGANGSGKSNLIKALYLMQEFILTSTDSKLNEEINYYFPFKLDEKSKSDPVNMEIEFINTDKIRYKYSVSYNRLEILKENFPFDVIEEVGKGVEGADCIQTVRNNVGVACGKIIYESKRTKAWSNSWIDKLKADKRNTGADVAILVTQAFPKDMDKFGERDGIWVCSFYEVASLAHALRGGIIKISEAYRSQEGKADKMQMLYDYLTGNEFRGQMEAIVEGFMSLKQGITKERVQMEKVWKEREKQIEKVLLSTSGMYGSVKGIAGASVSDIPLLEGTDDSTAD